MRGMQNSVYRNRNGHGSSSSSNSSNSSNEDYEDNDIDRKSKVGHYKANNAELNR